MWSYPNIYRDQKISATSIDGKEICDLLIVFGDHIIIFSDKYCEFPDTGNLQVDWNRWYKKAILKSARQIWGAERWIKGNPDRIFVDRKCEQKLPLELPKPDQMKIHRVAVAHGALNRCKQYFNSNSGLLINTTIQGENHVGNPQNIFNVGWVDRNYGFVHVLDDSSLDIVLQTLDTITDFIWYLEKKEKLVEKAAVFAASEEDLLGRYLHNTNKNGEHDFLPKEDEEIDYIGIEEGIWHDFLISPQRHAMIQANEISYYWDHLIENFSYHMMNNTQHFTTHPNDISG